jgi:hypothetical protein
MTYQEDLDYLKTYIEQRSVWIDNNIPGICDLSFKENTFVPQYHKVWPNPMSDDGYIGFTLFNEDEVAFELIDLTGRTVYSDNFGFKSKGEHANTLHLSFLSEGNYIYVLKKSGVPIGTGKINVK